MKRLFFLLVVLLAAGAFAQSAPAAKPAAKPAPPTVLTSELSAYLLPQPLKETIRDGQLEWDELEIENQKMQVKVEQNKARQKEITDSIRLGAYQFSQEKKIDLQLWELDPKQLKFIRKDAKAKK